MREPLPLGYSALLPPGAERALYAAFGVRLPRQFVAGLATTVEQIEPSGAVVNAGRQRRADHPVSTDEVLDVAFLIGNPGASGGARDEFASILSTVWRRLQPGGTLVIAAGSLPQRVATLRFAALSVLSAAEIFRMATTLTGRRLKRFDVYPTLVRPLLIATAGPSATTRRAALEQAGGFGRKVAPLLAFRNRWRVPAAFTPAVLWLTRK
jgi:hypothetical protein